MIDLSRTFFWRIIREARILRTHKRVASICERLIKDCNENPAYFGFKQKHVFSNERIIWQYWAQGYDNVPDVVRRCFDSVDYYASDYTIVRLSDSNLSEYLDIPDFIHARRGAKTMTITHFSDLLRLILLKTYGGIWMDATILLTGPIPKEYANQDFFVFRRDPAEPFFRYWRNVYAYYFGWAKGFRVNMLNSFIVAKKEQRTISEMTNLLILWWRDHEVIPDYFFFQILFDVLGCPENCLLVSDTHPHYLQQSINDMCFHIMDQETIKRIIPIHKLTYKQ